MATPGGVRYGNVISGALRGWTADCVRLEEVFAEAIANFEKWSDQVDPMLQLYGYPTDNVDRQWGLLQMKTSRAEIGGAHVGSQMRLNFVPRPVPLQAWEFVLQFIYEGKQLASSEQIKWRCTQMMQNTYSRFKLEALLKATMLRNGSSLVFDDYLTGDAKAQTPWWNADGEVPEHYAMNTFSGSHDHFHGVGSGGTVNVTEMEALLHTISEHGHNGRIQLYTDSVGVVALRKGGILNYAQMIMGQGALGLKSPCACGGKSESAPETPLFYPVGTTFGMQVLRSDLMPTGYILAVAVPESNAAGWAAPDSPLSVYVDAQPGLNGVHITGIEQSGTSTDVIYTGYYGIAVYNRGAGAGLDTTTGGGTYTDPTIDLNPWTNA